MGMRPLQILLKVELPLALPLIFAGIRTAAVFVVATATLGGIVGGGGLGDIIVNQSSYFLRGVLGASIAVTALAFARRFRVLARPAGGHAARAPDAQDVALRATTRLHAGGRPVGFRLQARHGVGRRGKGGRK